MKFLILLLWSSLSFASSSCHEVCEVHSLPYDHCVELHCPKIIPQDWGITCYADEAKLFQLNIDVIEKRQTARHYTSQYKVRGETLSGPRMTGYEFEEVMMESLITTRTHTGSKFGLYIKNYGSINLSLVDFSHDPEYFPVGFYGSLKLINQQKEIPLSCIKKYNLNVIVN